MSKVVLDLYSGKGGFSAAFEEADSWTVITVDVEEEHEPDIVADVRDLTHSDFEDYGIDVVLASPICTPFSMASVSHHFTDMRPDTGTAKLGLELVYHTIGLIKAIDPEYWFMENPRALMRKFIGEPGDAPFCRDGGVVWWCQYWTERDRENIGPPVAKPTDLWGRHPPSFEYLTCFKGSDDHEAAPRGSKTGTQDGEKDAADRAEIPFGLSMAVLNAVENPGTREQAGIGEFGT